MRLLHRVLWLQEKGMLLYEDNLSVADSRQHRHPEAEEGGEREEGSLVHPFQDHLLLDQH